MTPTSTSCRVAQHLDLELMASIVADRGIDNANSVVASLVDEAARRGANPILIAIVSDATQPQVARQRAFGRIAQALDRARHQIGTTSPSTPTSQLPLAS